jgi:hypothetical protein
VVVQRGVVEIEIHDVPEQSRRQVGPHEVVDRTVDRAQALDLDHALAGHQPQLLSDGPRGRDQALLEHGGSHDETPTRHVRVEARNLLDEALAVLVLERRFGGEGAPPLLANEDAPLDQVVDSLAQGDPTDAVLAAQARLRRQHRAGVERADALGEGVTNRRVLERRRTGAFSTSGHERLPSSTSHHDESDARPRSTARSRGHHDELATDESPGFQRKLRLSTTTARAQDST